MFIWCVNIEPSVSEIGPVYYLQKHRSRNFSYDHFDNELNSLLNKGIIVREDQVYCNYLADADLPDPLLFYNVASYLLLKAVSHAKDCPIGELIKEIKTDFQSPISADRMGKIIKHALIVFPEIGELTRSGVVRFKKQLRIDIEYFHKTVERLSRMSTKEYNEEISRLQKER